MEILKRIYAPEIWLYALIIAGFIVLLFVILGFLPGRFSRNIFTPLNMIYATLMLWIAGKADIWSNIEIWLYVLAAAVITAIVLRILYALLEKVESRLEHINTENKVIIRTLFGMGVIMSVVYFVAFSTAVVSGGAVLAECVDVGARALTDIILNG